MWRSRRLYPLHCRNIWDIGPTWQLKKRICFFPLDRWYGIYIYMKTVPLYTHMLQVLKYFTYIYHKSKAIRKSEHLGTHWVIHTGFWFPSTQFEKYATVKMGIFSSPIFGVNILKNIWNHENWVILRFPPPIIQSNEIQETWPTTAAIGWRIMWIFQCGPRSGQQFKRFLLCVWSNIWL